MEFDIIKTDYVKSLRGFSKSFRLIALLALIFMTLNYFELNFFEDNDSIRMVSTFIIGLFFILEFLNIILFSRIGLINFGTEKIVIDKADKQFEFLLSDIQNVEIDKVQNKHYFIKADSAFEEVIELNEGELIQLEDYFKLNQIDCELKSIGNWINKIFGGS